MIVQLVFFLPTELAAETLGYASPRYSLSLAIYVSTPLFLVMMFIAFGKGRVRSSICSKITRLLRRDNYATKEPVRRQTGTNMISVIEQVNEQSSCYTI